VHDVLDIFIKVRKKLAVKLVLIGQGPELSPLIQKAREYGADRDLIVLGSRENVNEIIASTDLLLLPSESESFGLTALEAMAGGTPPITSDVGGLPEIIKNGETGWMAPVGDTDAMAEKAINMLTDDSALKRMSKTAQQWAFDKFNINIALTAYEEHYQRALDER